MSAIDDYIANPDQALIDAAANPVFRQFMEPGDYEVTVVDYGDGTQAQVQALARGSIRNVMDRMLRRARQNGIDLKEWICALDEFNLCEKLNAPIGQCMRDLHAFLQAKWVQAGLTVAGLFALNAAVASTGPVLAIFTAIGYVNGVFVDLCECELVRI